MCFFYLFFTSESKSKRAISNGNPISNISSKFFKSSGCFRSSVSTNSFNNNKKYNI